MDVALPVPLTFWGNNASNLPIHVRRWRELRFICTYVFPIIHEHYAGSIKQVISMLSKYLIHLQKGRGRSETLRARHRSYDVLPGSVHYRTGLLFGYEVSLYNPAKLQLKAVLDASALAAGTQQTTDPSTNFTTVQNDAMNVATWMFSQNSILGDSASGVTNEHVLASPSSMSSVAAHNTEIGFQFINPLTAGVVTQGDINGKEIRVYGSYGFVPQFIGFAKLSGTFPVMDFSNGGLPMLDAVLCFDLSASMDDFTYVWLVHRYYNSTTTYADYATVNFTGNGNGMNPNGDTFKHCITH